MNVAEVAGYMTQRNKRESHIRVSLRRAQGALSIFKVTRIKEVLLVGVGYRIYLIGFFQENGPQRERASLNSQTQIDTIIE